MGRRAFAGVVAVSSLAVLLGLPTAATASPDGQAAGGGPASLPAGWSAACDGPGAGTAVTASCTAIELNRPGAWQGHHLIAASVGGGNATASATPAGYDPAELQNAYNLSAAIAGATTPRAVAIVDAYDDPNALSDLATYRAQWGLEPICTGTVTIGCVIVKKLNQQGQASPLPAPNAGWSEEISVDLDMASAICPSCNILLVEANSANLLNLGLAENTAAAFRPKAIGNSYGGPESALDPILDRYFYNHPGVAITASTGDSGYGVSYPASSPNVTAVGGTTLSSATTNSRGWTETAWPGAGSGCSGVETQPSWQTAVINIETECAKRAVADVAAVADPNTGVAVYDSYGLSGWTVFGGTSVSAQIISATYALAGGSGSATGASGLYGAPSGDFFDVTSGSNGSCGTDLCNAGVGWDGPTGLGTPDGTGAF